MQGTIDPSLREFEIASVLYLQSEDAPGQDNFSNAVPCYCPTTQAASVKSTVAEGLTRIHRSATRDERKIEIPLTGVLPREHL